MQLLHPTLPSTDMCLTLCRQDPNLGTALTDHEASSVLGLSVLAQQTVRVLACLADAAGHALPGSFVQHAVGAVLGCVKVRLEEIQV